MSPKIIYRELSGVKEINDCYSLQKKVFKTSDSESLPSMFLNLLTRDFPRVGFAIGAYLLQNKEEKLIGYSVLIKEVEANSIYLMAIGVLSEYKNKNIGVGMMNKIRDITSNYNIANLYCVFEPLNSTLANFYINKIGMHGVKYIMNTDDNNRHCNDKLLINWTYNQKKTSKKEIDYPYEEIPIVTNQKSSNNNRVLIQIPCAFSNLKQHEVLKWRIKTRDLFNEYLNSKKYHIVNTWMPNHLKGNHTYYLLDKYNINDAARTL